MGDSAWYRRVLFVVAVGNRTTPKGDGEPVCHKTRRRPAVSPVPCGGQATANAKLRPELKATASEGPSLPHAPPQKDRDAQHARHHEYDRQQAQRVTQHFSGCFHDVSKAAQRAVDALHSLRLSRWGPRSETPSTNFSSSDDHQSRGVKEPVKPLQVEVR